MEIGRDSNGAYFWRDYIDGKRIKRQNKDWKTKREVKQDYIQFMMDYENGKVSLTEPMISDVFEDYIEHISLSKKQSSVIREKQMLENTILPFFGNSRINQITPKKIQDFQRHLLNKTYKSKGQRVYISNTYIDLLQTTLNGFLDYSYRFGYIDKNPFDLVPRVKRREFQRQGEMTILTYEEYNCFIQHVDDVVYRALFDILYWCGLRIGEAMALSISDFQDNHLDVYKNFDTKNRIITTTKNDTNRIVSVPNRCVLSLNELIGAYKESEGINFDASRPLFRYDGIISKTTLDRNKNKYIKKANQEKECVPYFTFHELRHTHVSTLIDLGMESKDIADRLGHSVEMVNNTYGHLFPERKDKLLERLNELGSDE